MFHEGQELFCSVNTIHPARNTSDLEKIKRLRQYFYRSVKNFLLIVVSIVVLFIALAIIGWILPNKIYNGLVITSLYFYKEIGVAVVILIAIFLAYKAYLIHEKEESFGRELIKLTPAIIFWLVIVFCVANFFGGRQGYNCKKYDYTQQLNGGAKIFQGKRYMVSICGSGVNNSHYFGDSMEAVELTVKNDTGEIMAKRHYKVFWDGQPGHEPLVIGRNSITYQDDEKQKDYVINVPPTMVDWVKARIPFFN